MYRHALSTISGTVYSVKQIKISLNPIRTWIPYDTEVCRVRLMPGAALSLLFYIYDYQIVKVACAFSCGQAAVVREAL